MTKYSSSVRIVFLTVVVAVFQMRAGLSIDDPSVNFRNGMRLMEARQFDDAASALWQAIIQYEGARELADFTVEEAFRAFMQCYVLRGKPAEGYFFIAQEYLRRTTEAHDSSKEASLYLEKTLELDPNHAEARRLLAQLQRRKKRQGRMDRKVDSGLTPEQLYEMGNNAFNNKQLASAAQYFEDSCQLSNERLGPACGNAVFCRAQICDWGVDGQQFEQDMHRIDVMLNLEQMTHAIVDPETKKMQWKRTVSVHPHMMLGYLVDPKLQRVSSESYAATDELRSRVRDDKTTGGIRIMDLPIDLPYNSDEDRTYFLEESTRPNFRIRLGIVSSAIKSTAVLYLTNQMFQFFNKTRFEIHVFATSPPDHPQFIQTATSGSDWRQYVKRYADYFHDVQHLAQDHIGLARYIHDELHMHIVMDWDGYARQGSRPQGLFALRPAPVQLFHQEFLGTSGATYVDYLISDQLTSPPELDYLYTEKLIYMPHHFFSKSHAFMKEMSPPRTEYTPATDPYTLGTGSPQENRCLSYPDDEEVSFVFCNFHKFLKFHPEIVKTWMNILQRVPYSILCLLENPGEGIPYLRTFIDGIDPDLNDRVLFIKWEINLFNHHIRNRDLCNAVIDTYPYNGHTTTMDALFAGVPVITRNDLAYMAARVSSSANNVLQLSECNANGIAEYENVAVQLGTNATLYASIRERLLDSCLQNKPRHPFWDVKRYVRDFENGLDEAWKRYLMNAPRNHVVVRGVSDDFGVHTKRDNLVVAIEEL